MKKVFNFFLFSLILTLCCGVLTSCGNDDDDVDSALVGTWGISGMIDGYYVESTMKFKANGTVIMSEKEDGESYSITNQYSVSGDLSKGAVLRIWGHDADGDYFSSVFLATIRGDKLTLYVQDGEDEGESLTLKRM